MYAPTIIISREHGSLGCVGIHSLTITLLHLVNDVSAGWLVCVAGQNQFLRVPSFPRWTSQPHYLRDCNYSKTSAVA